VVLVIALVVTRFTYATDQSAENDPRELIRDLTHQTIERRSPSFVGCGEVTRDRLVARALAQMGQMAVPPLEEALDSIEQSGAKSRFARGAGWLLDSYAKIEGSAADLRLRRMANDPKLAFLSLDLDIAIALAQSTTSRVSASQMLANVADCTRSREPRHALDQLILAWERGDRRWFESSLGPRARGGLKTLLRRGTWDKMRAEFWRGHSGGDAAVGYLFNNAGLWAEPWETLEGDKQYGPVSFDLGSPKIETLFKASGGSDCGKHDVEFVEVLPGKKWMPPLAYLVNNADLSDLLRTITACATEGMPATPHREPRI